MAYSDSFPAIRPSFQFSADAGRLDSRISYSRSTTGTYFGTDKHLSSENLIKHSEGSAVWGGTATITYGYTNGPDGVTGTALRLESASGTERYRYSTGGQFVSGTAYTVSCWVKSNTGVAQTFRFMCSTTANQSANLTTHATDWTRVTATITPNTTNIFAGFVFLSANTNDISVWGLQVNTGSSALDYQATTTQIHREYAPTLQTAAINAPRFEHSASDSASMGLLVEGSSQNLLSYSEDFTNAAWDKVVATGYQAPSISDSVAIGPDGLLSASSCTASTTTAYQEIRHAATVGSGAVAFSVYAKAVGASKRLLLREDATSGASAAFDLLTGTVVGTNSGGVGSIEPVGNGYYRCTMVCTPGSGSQLFAIWMIENSATTFGNVTGDGYSGFLLFGAQVENQSFASSYIKSNSGSATTRAADSASAVTSDIGYTGGPFTIVSETEGGYGAFPRAFTLTDGTPDNRIEVHKSLDPSTSSTGWYAYASVGGATYVIAADIPSSAGASKVAISYDTNDVGYCAGGNTVGTDTSAYLPSSINALHIGSTWSTSYNQLNGHIKRIALYGEALSDTNLQALTS